MSNQATCDVATAQQYLTTNQWPSGLQNQLFRTTGTTALRFFVVDDSGSMGASDGHRIIGNGSSTKMVNCTRWQELGEAMRFHAGLAEALGTPTEFRVLNGAPPIIIGQRDDNGANLRAFDEILSRPCGGGTPLCRHLNEIADKIHAAEGMLRASAQKAAVIVFTDGESSDGDVATAMRRLQTLPCFVIIRLCTDEDRIEEYWNNVDKQLEMELEVVDDLSGEATEIGKCNNWFVYGLALHRLREWGVRFKELDFLDEKKLSYEEMKRVCSNILLGGDSELPEPELDWKVFERSVRDASNQQPEVFDPITKKMHRWIKASELNKAYDPKSCTIA